MYYALTKVLIAPRGRVNDATFINQHYFVKNVCYGFCL
jgi:hypothetical protein